MKQFLTILLSKHVGRHRVALSTRSNGKNWVSDAKAAALPGAVEFTTYARSRGVTIFYVTNRSASQKAATGVNLQREGFPFETKVDTLYCLGERPDWGSDKSTRRAEIARKYRILLLFRDDFGDFASGAASTVDERRELAESYRARWGQQWIVFPNAMYGSWETALYASQANATDKQKSELKLQLLQTMARGSGAGSRGKP